MNDHERRALADLERHLQHDAEFAARMSTFAGVPAAAEQASPAVPVLCALLFIAVPLVMLLFGWVGVLIVLDLFAAAVAVILIRRRAAR
ncbi:hypothetical protein Acy02nite_61690 [Actinoplanes cyaneus]|uniref:DUF3040 domain-containing protein n=1 Tax=Actinoplanes cyaneus TaxID=52696 RepID=A0A919M8E2_9ACTN|nr:DUF3040 domain-containing protein [Actinoplanes cyaneus]GID68288.1 hypothetical protein Acy02nite_61690 [Actinoplanes cyaneus]